MMTGSGKGRGRETWSVLQCQADTSMRASIFLLVDNRSRSLSVGQSRTTRPRIRSDHHFCLPVS